MIFDRDSAVIDSRPISSSFLYLPLALSYCSFSFRFVCYSREQDWPASKDFPLLRLVRSSLWTCAFYLTDATLAGVDGDDSQLLLQVLPLRLFSVRCLYRLNCLCIHLFFLFYNSKLSVSYWLVGNTDGLPGSCTGGTSFSSSVVPFEVSEYVRYYAGSFDLRCF